MRTDRLNSFLCAALVVVFVLSTVPLLEMGVNDDWSYTYIARGFAATGHFPNTGWIGAMMGLQIWWAALLIRLFGFSFTLLRLSTLPFAAGCALLLYRLARHAGLNPSYALFGSLSVTLSPVFIPVAASFMTDIPSFFFWLACFYCAVRASEAAGAIRASAWIAAAAATGFAGGTIRQIVWIAPFLVLPSVAWIRRRERPVLAVTALLWCASALAVVICLRWFGTLLPAEAPPHSDGMPPLLDVLRDTARLLRYVVRFGLKIVVAGLLLILPVLSGYLAGWKKFPRAPYALALGLLASGAVLAASLWLFHNDLLMGNIVTATGILGSGTEAMGVKPEILPAPVRGLLALAVFFSAGVTAACLFGGFCAWLKSLGRGASFGAHSDPLGLFAFLLAPSCFVCTLAIVYHAVDSHLLQRIPLLPVFLRVSGLFDRYLILLLPGLVIPLLWHYQQRTRQAPPVLGWAVLGLFAFYGATTTHDYLAAGRARLQAASAVTAEGVPRVHVTAGFEYDGWTEVEHSGRLPPYPDSAEWVRRFPVSSPYWFWALTPSIEPRYFVVYSRVGGLVDSPFPPIQYTTWLPPFHRQVLTQVAP